MTLKGKETGFAGIFADLHAYIEFDSISHFDDKKLFAKVLLAIMYQNKEILAKIKEAQE